MNIKNAIIKVIDIQEETVKKIKSNNDGLLSLSSYVTLFKNQVETNNYENDMLLNIILDDINGEENESINAVHNVLDQIIN